MSQRRIAVYGGSFNPPIGNHVAIARLAAGRFDETVVLPCGTRPDKMTVNDMDSTHRAALADLAFGGIPRAVVRLDDLEEQSFTRTADVDRQFRVSGADVWHVVGSEFTIGGAHGRSEIQTKWHEGRDLWAHANFAVVERPGSPLRREDLPPHADVIGSGPAGSSTDVRGRVFGHQAFRHLVPEAVADYVERWGLYRGVPPLSAAPFRPAALRPRVLADRQNPNAERVRPAFEAAAAAAGAVPNCLAVLGGDGFLLETLRAHWRERLPVLGLNAGHRGFFMNRVPETDAAALFRRTDLIVRRMPLLHVRLEGTDGSVREALAVNDAWVERATGQTAWIRVLVDGRERLACLRADGAIVATPVGSTGYVRAMGATPLFDQPGLVLAGSNPDQPAHWRPVILPIDAVVRFEALDPVKRPLRGFVDSHDQGGVVAMEIRSSRIASVELVFAPEDDLPEKRLRALFPPA